MDLNLVPTSTCPVLALPTEITAEIFSYYVGKRHDIRRKDAGPLLLASVCKSWNEICFSTCSLWASVFIVLDRAEDGVPFPPVQRWLSRAGSHPLDLFVSVHGGNLSEILSCLAQHSAQWWTLGFEFHLSSSVVNELVPGQIPLLTELEISGIPFGHGTSPPLLTAFTEAPSLRKVWLSNASLDTIHLPWIQLTHLTAAGCLAECLKILNETRNLEVLDIVTDAQHTARSSLELTLPHLRTFRCSDGPEGVLLSHLTLPALRTLELSGLESDGVFRFLRLSSRSAWSLRSIRLSAMEYTDSIICLQSLPSLEEVEIEIWESGDNLTPLVELLAMDNGFLPALCSMTVRAGGGSTEASPSALAEMLASRWHGNRQGIAKLKSFHLSFFHLSMLRNVTGSLFQELKTRVAPLTEEGLDVVIRIA
ncbi:F-box domain-containing protein [Mycena sanguinolenta]|uniref:F-box domain-containing protein n=1 Tax=Mycena sanguinolenta TaxID=230812 RepID=A0A8H6X8B5_9AGAR|nr:F-box domain-containing protein [Mycena sanguinolenta]